MARHHVQHRDQLAQRTIDTLGAMADAMLRVDPDIHRVLQLARAAIMARHGAEAWNRWCDALIAEGRIRASDLRSDAARQEAEQGLLEAS